jgi:hypothetical protein
MTKREKTTTVESVQTFFVFSLGPCDYTHFSPLTTFALESKVRRHLVSSLSGTATAVRTVFKADCVIEDELSESQWTVGNMRVQEDMSVDDAASDQDIELDDMGYTVVVDGKERVMCLNRRGVVNSCLLATLGSHQIGRTPIQNYFGYTLFFNHATDTSEEILQMSPVPAHFEL